MNNVIHLGSYVYGDTGTDLTISIVDENGEATDLSGSSAITLVCRSAARDTFEVTGATSGAPSTGVVVFENLGTAFTPTTARPKVNFRGQVKWTQGGELHWSRDAVRFAIELFP